MGAVRPPASIGDFPYKNGARLKLIFIFQNQVDVICIFYSNKVNTTLFIG
jgi:hypothetical protein